MPYIENPKTKGSGIICAIPQSTECPVGCRDCFFQSGRSYLEPLEKNLPNLPPVDIAQGRVVRVNDGNDSNVDRDAVIAATEQYPRKFYNTSIPKLRFPGPVVLTVNPATMTDVSAHLLKTIPSNLMYVRVRVNSWNTNVVDEVVAHYTRHSVPVVLTFMAYFQDSPKLKAHYSFRRRTTNSYWVVKQQIWDAIVRRYRGNELVYTCGKAADIHDCKRCGNCLREYYATMERMATGGRR